MWILTILHFYFSRWPRTPKAFFDQTLLCKLNEGKHLTKSEEQAICFYLYEDAKRFGKALVLLICKRSTQTAIRSTNKETFFCNYMQP